MTREVLISALNYAFSEHMDKLFHNLAVSHDEKKKALERFKRGFNTAIERYDEIMKLIEARPDRDVRSV